MSEKALVLDEVRGLGDVFVKSGFFTDARDASQAMVKILAGRELGFSPIASMVGVYIVQGKPCLSANLIASRIKASGKYDYRVKMMTPEKCEIEFFEGLNGSRQSIGVSTFSIEDARKAGTKNLEKYARNMLFARAMSNGAKWFCPDAFSGVTVYTPEELGADTNGDGELVEIKTIESPATAAPSAEPASIDTPSHAEVIADEIRTVGRGITNAKAKAEPQEVQRLAAVVGQAFETQPPETRDSLRHAVYSYVYRKEVQTGKDLPNGLVVAMLQRWESTTPWNANTQAATECAELARQYQIDHGQEQMELK